MFFTTQELIGSKNIAIKDKHKIYIATCKKKDKRYIAPCKKHMAMCFKLTAQKT